MKRLRALMILGALALFTLPGCDLIAGDEPSPSPAPPLASPGPASPTVDPSPDTSEASPPLSAPPSPASDATTAEPLPTFAPGDYARVVAGGLRVRTAPGTDSPVVGALFSGDIVQIVSGPAAANDLTWYEVRIGDLAGFVAAGDAGGAFLEPSVAPAPTPAPTA